jgi:hypothetical protein
MADWGDSILLTVEEVRSIGEYATPPSISGLDYTDTDYQSALHAGGSLAFTIDPDSARAHGHDPNDLTIILRVPGIDQYSCDAQAVFGFDGLLFAFAGEVGIYGPEPALTHDDWVGASGATSPSAGGAFAVSAEGATLTLTLPCNYGTLCDDIPNQNLPTGMSGCPQVTYYHRADVWRSYDGQLGQDGNPYSIPPEARWCWRGYPCLKLPLTAPAAGLLTVTLECKRHTHTDNHKSDSTRQEDYEHDEVAQTNTYTVWVPAGTHDCYVYLDLAQERRDPDLEQVVSVQLSGMQLGAWSLGEPTLAVDPIHSKAVLKVFEGPEYRHGGFSAVNSPDRVYALMDTTENNNAHANIMEWVVRMFDYREGVGEDPADLTVAWSLDSIATILHNVCEAWECSVDDDALDAATLDDEDNRLTTCWAFDVCHPDCHLVGDDRQDRPLLQAVDEALNVSIRCRTWTIAPGIVYAVRSDLVVGGAAHGMGYSGLRTPARDQTARVQIWRKADGTPATSWVEHGAALDIDEFALWHSAHLQEYNPADDLRWDYGVSLAGEDEPSHTLGKAPLREYNDHALLAPGEGGIHMFTHPAGLVPWTVLARPGTDIIIYETTSADTTISTPVVVDGSGNYSSAFGWTDGSVFYIDAYNDVTGQVDRFVSRSHAATWSGPTQVTGL